LNVQWGGMRTAEKPAAARLSGGNQKKKTKDQATIKKSSTLDGRVVTYGVSKRIPISSRNKNLERMHRNLKEPKPS